MKKISLIFVSILLAFLFVMDNYWSGWLVKQTSEKQIWIRNLKEKKYDYAFLGSSRVYTCIDIDTINKKTGRKAINLGCDGSSLMENYILLKQFLKSGNNINELYLQIDQSALIDMNKAYSYPFHDYLFLDKLNEEEVKEAIQQTKGNLRYFFWRFVPGFKYAEFNNFYNIQTVIPLLSSSRKPNNYDLSSGSLLIPKGNGSLDDVDTSSLRSEFIVNDLSLSYLKKIIETCKESNIRCYLFKVPVYENSYKNNLSHKQAESFIKQFSNELKLPFIDFQPLVMSGDPECFKDKTHLSKYGAHVFSAILADSLIQKQ